MLDHVPELYYTAAEARAQLGLNANTFQTWVKTGRITRTMLPGVGHGLYLKRDIDRKAQLIAAAMFLDTSGNLEYKAAKPQDVDSEIHLAHLIYGKKVLRPEAQKARRQLVATNPESTWHLYDRDTLAASLNIVPVDHEAIAQFKQGVRGWLFVPDHVRQFEPGVPLELIVIDFMTTPAVPPEKRHYYGQFLLRELANTTLRQWGSRGIEISRLYACGSTDAGRKLLRNKWFQELGEPVPGRVIFELDDVMHADLQLLQPYQETIRAGENTKKEISRLAQAQAKAASYNDLIDERNRISRENREKPWLPPTNEV